MPVVEFILWGLLTAVTGAGLILLLDTVYMAITGKSKLGR